VSNDLTAAGIGSRMVKIAPLRSDLFAPEIVPCIASTNPREMASPSPVPARTKIGFVNTIRRAELSEGQTALTAANEGAIRRALEGAGVVFIEENGGGPGVRLRERRKARARAK